MVSAVLMRSSISGCALESSMDMAWKVLMRYGNAVRSNRGMGVLSWLDGGFFGCQITFLKVEQRPLSDLSAGEVTRTRRVDQIFDFH